MYFIYNIFQLSLNFILKFRLLILTFKVDNIIEKFRLYKLRIVSDKYKKDMPARTIFSFFNIGEKCYFDGSVKTTLRQFSVIPVQTEITEMRTFHKLVTFILTDFNRFLIITYNIPFYKR